MHGRLRNAENEAGQRGYLGEVEDQRVLRQVIDTAELALPMLTREIEKCRN